MKITLFTTNNIRHNYLIRLMSTTCDTLYVVQETLELFDNIIPSHYQNSKLFKNYFEKVNEAQNKIFSDFTSIKNQNNIHYLKIPFGQLNECSVEKNKKFFSSDIYIVFGSSYIKDKLLDFLIEKKAINIHMGVSPYYRGTDCNFWALFDGNPHLVGATIHLLSKGLDSGPIFYHAMSNLKTTPFEYSMSAVKSAFLSLLNKIKDRSLFEIKPINQEQSKQIRYTKKIDFNNTILEDYLKKKINLQSKNFDFSLLKDPFFL